MKKVFICLILAGGMFIACTSTPKSATETTVDSVEITTDSLISIDSIILDSTVTNSIVDTL